MEQLLLQLFESTNGILAYGLVFAVLLLCGMGVPLPEDVSLILGGFLAYEQKANLYLMMLVGYAGILIGDSMIFYFGRRIGSRVGTRGGFFARIVTPEKRARVEGLFRRHGEKIVMLARFLPGVRAVTYFTAGSVGMRYSHFAFFDSIAALASAPVFVFLGYYFGGELEQLIQAVRRGQTRVLVGLLVAIVGYFVVTRLWRRYRASKTAEPPALNPPVAAPTAVPKIESPAEQTR